MKGLGVLAGMLLWLVSGAASGADISLETEFQIEPSPLVTDQILKIDSDVSNPHRQRWALERNVELRGLETFPINPKTFGVRASGLVNTVRLHLRGPGPWYRPISEFPCTKDMQAWFATESGARLEGKTAADLWTAEMDSARLKLSLAMERMQGDSEEAVLAKGKKLFQIWLRGATKAWREQLKQKVRIAEWQSYLDTAASEGICTASTQNTHVTVPWADMMEPPATEGPNQLVARSPARRWDGLFSIRAIIVAGDKKLDGKFLVDTESEQSLLSPDWLINQGLNPQLIAVANAPMEKINWGGENKLARKVEVEATYVGDARVPLTTYFVRQIDLFDTPDNVASCCDGVLGRNFLRNYAVEFKPGAPSEVLLWNPAGFHLGPEAIWVELSEVPEHGMSSDCAVQSGKLSIPGVFWDTGSDIGMTIHSAWSKAARALKGSWDLQCGSETIVTHLERNLKMETLGKSSESLGMKNPGATLGMPVLGRGSVTIDLPHGRLWMAKSGLRAEIPVNRSGLNVKYVDEDGDRVLRVAELNSRSGSPAAELVRMGLKKGMRISEVDGKPAEDLDLWNVNQRLSGIYGNTVIIKWKTANGIKIGALKLSGTKPLH